MNRKEKQRAKVESEDDDDDTQNDHTGSNPIIVVSSDDEEANEDLSLKIVQKALLKRAAKLVPNDEVLDETTSGRGSGCNGDLVDSSSCQAESVVVMDDDALGGASGIVASEVSEVDNGEVKMSRRKKKKVKKVDTGEGSVIVAEEKEMIQTMKSTDKIKSEAAITVQMGNNIVLKKLLRGPRYFDPPDSGWGTCYNCGEEGHVAVNCTAAKRKKPCFVCGSLDHKSKQCNKAQDCFICKKGGHRAKDCPEKFKGGSKSSICLKCGDSGHDMFSCKNNYSLDDLKEIQCYICKRFGHLCCVSSEDDRLGEVSCYKCGRLGHTGLACSRLRGETTGEATPSSCYKCGEEGHFARECTSSAKVGKRNRESSNQRTPFLKFHKDKDYNGYKSAPHDMGKAHKKKKVITEEKGFTTPKKSKHRGGWITEDPEDFSPKRFRKSSWRSSATPSTTMSSRSPRMWDTGSSKLQGSAKFSQHRYSASRFGNPASSGHGRNYDWW